MPTVIVSRDQFLEERHGRRFADVVTDPDGCFDEVLAFFQDEARQLRMEESEIHHDRAPLAGVVRELESHPVLEAYFASKPLLRAKRLRQAIGLLVRMIMERRGWKKTGRKGSLGVRSAGEATSEAESEKSREKSREAGRETRSAACHNTGGLAYWFLRAERYERAEGMPFRSVRERNREASSNGASRAPSPKPRAARRSARRSAR